MAQPGAKDIEGNTMKRLALLFVGALFSAAFANADALNIGIPQYDNESPMISAGAAIVSEDNSASTPLGSNGVFTGTWESALNYSVVLIAIKSDVASATNGLIVEFSADESNIVSDDTFTLPADSGKTYSFQPAAKYFRVVYSNGVTPQSSFILHTQMKANYVKPSSHRIGDSIVAEDDAELVKSAITGEDSLGNWQNVSVTQDGNLSISDESSGLSIARGNVVGVSVIHKFGDAPDFDIGDGFVTVWDGANDGGIDQMQYVYSTTDDIDSIISSDAADTEPIEIMGLDLNGDEVTQTNTLTGQTRSALTTPLWRIFRMKNIGTANLVGITSAYVTNSPTSLGVVDDSSHVRAIINNGNNQTLMSLYTIPNGKTGYNRSFFVGASGARKTSVHEIKLLARPYGQVFQLKHKSAINAQGTSHFNHVYPEPPVYLSRTDLEIRVNTDEAEAGVSGGLDLVIVDDE